MFSIKSSGNLSKITKRLKELEDPLAKLDLDAYGRKGVEALSAATPARSGETAMSWSYKIKKADGRVTLSWHNGVMAGDTPLAVILQYGHGTRNGGHVEGRDYINPAIRPVFDQMLKDASALLYGKR